MARKTTAMKKTRKSRKPNLRSYLAVQLTTTSNKAMSGKKNAGWLMPVKCKKKEVTGTFPLRSLALGHMRGL